MLVKPVSVEVYEDTWSNSQIVTYEHTGMEKIHGVILRLLHMNIQAWKRFQCTCATVYCTPATRKFTVAMWTV